MCIRDSLRQEMRKEIPPLTMGKIKDAVQCLKRRKAPGSDGLPAEIFMSASTITLQHVKDFFERLLRSASAPPSSWHHERIKLVPKDPIWRGDLGRLRPLLPPSATHKLFSRVVLHRLTEVLKIKAPQYARKGMSPASVIHHYALATQKCYDRGIPLYILKLDLSSAYDCVLQQLLLHALSQGGAPQYLVTVVEMLITGRKVHFACGPWDTTEIHLPRGLAQGHGLSPFLFGYYTYWFLHPLLEQWLQEDAELWPIIVLVLYMDDGLVAASSLSTLQRRATQLQAALQKLGLRLNPAKCQVHHNQHAAAVGDPRIQLTLDGNVIRAATGPLIFLGHCFSMQSGSASAAVHHRLAQSGRTLWVWAPLLRCKDSDLKARLRLMWTILTQSVFHGCGAWHLCQVLSRKLRAHATTWMVRVQRVARDPQHSWVEHYIYTRRVARRALTHAGLDVLQEWAKRYFQWAGHIARSEDPIDGLFRWLPLQQRHLGRRQGRLSEWEVHLIEIIGGQWAMRAQDRQHWLSQLPAWVNALVRRGEDAGIH
eukprot:4124619-Amphidinium_carterae.1